MADITDLELVNAVLEHMHKEMPEVTDAKVMGQFVYFFDKFDTMIAWTTTEAVKSLLKERQDAQASA